MIKPIKKNRLNRRIQFGYLGLLINPLKKFNYQRKLNNSMDEIIRNVHNLKDDGY